jgi:hypothetical protein
MRANDLADPHGSWIGSIHPIMGCGDPDRLGSADGGHRQPQDVHGPSCTLCSDAQHCGIERKGMGQ